jgi:hypothetical protein
VFIEAKVHDRWICDLRWGSPTRNLHRHRLEIISIVPSVITTFSPSLTWRQHPLHLVLYLCRR